MVSGIYTRRTWNLCRQYHSRLHSHNLIFTTFVSLDFKVLHLHNLKSLPTISLYTTWFLIHSQNMTLVVYNFYCMHVFMFSYIYMYVFIYIYIYIYIYICIFRTYISVYTKSLTQKRLQIHYNDFKMSCNDSWSVSLKDLTGCYYLFYILSHLRCFSFLYLKYGMA